MIYKLTGKLIMKEGGKIAVDTGGVAYELSTPMSTYATLPDIGEQTEIFTHFAAREDGVSLYGFSSLEEKSLFLLLNKVSKIGPKMALAILSNTGRDAFINAISSEDAAYLSKVPGIGRKTAERIIVELKDKIKIAESMETISASSIETDVLSALTNLGYKASDVEKVLSRMDKEDSFQTLFKKVLAKLAG